MGEVEVAGEHAGGDSGRPEGQAGDGSERGGASRTGDAAERDGDHDEEECSDEDAPAFGLADGNGLVLGRRGTDEDETEDDDDQSHAVGPAQGHREEDGPEDRGDGEEARDDRLDHEERERPHRDQRQHESEAVQTDPDEVSPGPGQPEHETGIEAVHGVRAACGQRLEHCTDAVAEGGAEGAGESEDHRTTVRQSGPEEVGPRATERIDAVLFAYSAAMAAGFAYVLLRDGARSGWPGLLLVVFWLFVSYLVLPRLHAVLTSIYVPGYFIGRTRTSDGLLGDPVNVGLLGEESQVHAAFEQAGWTRAEDLGVRAAWRITRSVLMRRSCPSAPVSPLHLFDRQQDFAYQQEVAGSPSKRHHVRLWRCPDDWLLPGGFPVQWLGAATYDRRVGVSLFTLQVTHKIDEDIDVERDFVVGALDREVAQATVRTLARFASGYHSRNGGGDRIRTDGDLPIVDLRAVGVGPGKPDAPTDSRDRRPATVVAGSGLALARAAWYAGLAVVALADPSRLTGIAGSDFAEYEDGQGTGLLVAVLAVLTAVDVLLAGQVLRGSTRARLVLMTACAMTAGVIFLAAVSAREPVAVPELPALGGSILVLLALSSPRAREWTSRRTRSRRSMR